MTTVDEPSAATANPAEPHFSWSAIKQAVDCAKALQLARFLGLPPTPGYSLAGGSAVHEATEFYDRQHLALTGR